MSHSAVEAAKQRCREEEFREQVLQTKDRVTLPVELEQQLLSLLNWLEQTTGEVYQLTLHQPNAKKNLVLKPLNQRPCYQVSDMKAEYQELNGAYASFQALEQAIRRFRFTVDEHSLLTADEKYWQCPKCGKGPEELLQVHDHKVICRNTAEYGWYDTNCQFCQYELKSKWHLVQLSPDSNMIYLGGHGRVIFPHPIGKLTIPV